MEPPTENMQKIIAWASGTSLSIGIGIFFYWFLLIIRAGEYLQEGYYDYNGNTVTILIGFSVFFLVSVCYQLWNPKKIFLWSVILVS